MDRIGTKAIRLLLVDDHRLVREGIRSLLQRIDGMEVVAEASDGREALERIKSHHPDVLLLDIGMKGMNGLETAARAAREFPNVHVMVLSMHAHEEYVSQALQAGVSGYILKDSGSSELEMAIRAVGRGEKYLTPAISRHVIDDYLQRMGNETRMINLLTPRQREVLQLIAEGNTTKEIAAVLQVGVKTVETHRAKLMERANIHDIAGLVRFAIRLGLVHAEAWDITGVNSRSATE